MSEDGNGRDGTLSPRGRFERMETLLHEHSDQMEEILREVRRGLETKADREDLDGLGGRVNALEAGENPMARLILERFRAVEERVDNLTTMGSRQAQDAEKLAHALELEVRRMQNRATEVETTMRTERAAALEGVEEESERIRRQNARRSIALTALAAASTFLTFLVYLGVIHPA